MKTRNVVLCVTLVLCSGCWSWSFPEPLLEVDEDVDAGEPLEDPDAGEGGEGGAGEGGTGEGGGGTDGGGIGGIAGKGGIAGSAQGGAGGGVRCGADKPCPVGAPVCAPSGQCQGCTAHAQCAGGLCTTDGRCPGESEITYVSDQCPSTREGTKAKPLCDLKEALGRAPPFIFVNRGAYQDTVVARGKHLYGDNNATLQSTSCSALTIQAKAVQVVGFNIAGGVTLKSESEAKLIRNRIVSSPCVGVTAEAGANLTMDRNLVRLNQGGGVNVFGPTYKLINNIIVENGSSGSSSTEFGGVRLHQASSDPMGFMNNTVVENTSKGGDKDPAGVHCDVKADILNSIIWPKPATAMMRQLSALCAPSHSLLPAGEGSLGTANIFSDPKFISNQVAGTPAYYQLAADSPALDKAAVGGPAYDFLGQLRGSKPDIGALERPR